MNFGTDPSQGYFTKYVGKEVEADASGSTGRFWGIWRKDKMPWAAKVEGTIPDKIAVDQNRIARKIRRKRADAARQAVFAKLIKFNPFSPSLLHHAPLTLWDLERLRAGYSRSGRDTEEAAIYLRIIGYHAQEYDFRPGKYRFKTKPGRPHPDELKIVLTGNHAPDMMRRAAEWSAERHGLRKPKERSGPFRPKLP